VSDKIVETGQNCNYCGAPLNPFYYFCSHCGKPYKNYERVLTPEKKDLYLADSTLINQKAPGVWNIFFSYMAVIVISAIVSLFLFISDSSDSGNELLLNFIIGDSLLFVLTLFYCVKYKTLLAPLFKKLKFNFWYALLGFFLLFLALSINYGQMVLFEETLDVQTGYDVPVWASILFICLSAGIFEEIAFRGLILPMLDNAIGFTKALFLSSALFAGLHFNLVFFPYLFLVGMLLGYIRKKCDNIYIPMILHALHNAAVVFIFPLLLEFRG
jgi:membrane protease YdiL (CAAX protease family)